MADLSTKAAAQRGLDFIWQVYAEAVGTLMSQYISKGWNDKVEKGNFKKSWSVKNTHIVVLVDGKPVGWFSFTTSDE